MQPYFIQEYLDGEGFQGSTDTRPSDTIAAKRLVGGAVGLANEMSLSGVEEPPVTVIEGDRDMSADVFVGDDLVLENRDETLALNPFLTESELEGFFLLEIGEGN